MKKIYFTSFMVAMMALLFLNINAIKAADFNYEDDDSYKSIVKVKVFGVNQYYHLSEAGYGSGVIISPDGLVLTNHHVVNIENSYDGGVDEEEVVINICLNLEANKEPVCHYQAKLIAQDKDMDIALLKMEPIPGLGTKTNFQAMTLSESGPSNSSQVMALGFPAIGGDSLTLTQGIISGQIEKFNKKWIKTDAEISFGNSGGALINSSGELIGISSAVYADKLGSIGYALDVSSIRPWLDANKQKAPQSHAFLARMQALVKKQEAINNSNSFHWDYLGLSIDKDSSWEFDYSDEFSLYIDRLDDQDGGSIELTLFKFPFDIENIAIESVLGYLDMEHEGFIEFKNSEKISISGQEALRLTMSFLGDDTKIIVFPKDNFLILSLYDYGKNSKDKNIVDNIVSSISFKESIAIEPAKYYYSDSYHNFSLSTGGDWLLQPLNDWSSRVRILNKNSLSYGAGISVSKQNDAINADKFIEGLESDADMINRMSSMMNLVMDIKSIDKNYIIAGDLGSVTRVELDIKKNNGDFKFKNITYVDFRDDDIYQFSLSAAVDDSELSKIENDFLAILKTFKYDANAPATQVNFSDTSDNGNILPPGNNVPKTMDNNTPVDIKLSQRLAGKILLQVENNGEAWYVDKDSLERFYLKDGASAYQALRLFGLGISNDNLNKIPVAVDERLIIQDSDSDGLDDNLELAISTDPFNPDSDGDGFLDGVEVSNGYNPLGAGKLLFDQGLTQRMEGKILLQVESRGEAWYVHEGKRYYLANGESAYQAMRFLSTGITNENLNKILIGAQSSQ
jgi:hypothetical protein